MFRAKRSRNSGLTPVSVCTKTCARLRRLSKVRVFRVQPVTVFAPHRPAFGQLPVWRLAHSWLCYSHPFATSSSSATCLSRQGLIFLSLPSASLLARIRSSAASCGCVLRYRCALPPQRPWRHGGGGGRSLLSGGL
jgi:hypothetical protein